MVRNHSRFGKTRSVGLSRRERIPSHMFTGFLGITRLNKSCWEIFFYLLEHCFRSIDLLLITSLLPAMWSLRFFFVTASVLGSFPDSTSFLSLAQSHLSKLIPEFLPTPAVSPPGSPSAHTTLLLTTMPLLSLFAFPQCLSLPWVKLFILLDLEPPSSHETCFYSSNVCRLYYWFSG